MGGGGGDHSPDFAQELDDYLKSSWHSFAEWALQTQGQLTKWLFTLQGAGIAGSLGFANSRGLSCALAASLVCFVAGIVFSC